MKREKEGIRAWIKAHKKELILAGLGITAIIALVVGIRNKAELMELWSRLKKSISPKASAAPAPISTIVSQGTAAVPAVTPHSYSLPQHPVEVNPHLRTMSLNRHHSPQKALEAAAMGIELLPNQTWVDAYTKYAAA